MPSGLDYVLPAQIKSSGYPFYAFFTLYALFFFICFSYFLGPFFKLDVFNILLIFPMNDALFSFIQQFIQLFVAKYSFNKNIHFFCQGSVILILDIIHSKIYCFIHSKILSIFWIFYCCIEQGYLRLAFKHLYVNHFWVGFSPILESCIWGNMKKFHCGKSVPLPPFHYSFF